MRVCRSTSPLAHENLAWEDAWVDDLAGRGPALLFYVNDAAVVVGKNQNPWRECATGALEREGVRLARRISGGGTVYHDGGNLNYALILDRASYRQNEVFGRVLAALRALGVRATCSDGHSLVAGGLKISGNAFCFRGSAVLHHGTVLVDADLDRLRRCLVPALPDIVTRAIASRPARVANLRDLSPGLTLLAVEEALARELAGGGASEAVRPGDDPACAALAARHADPAWVWGHTPAFDWHFACEEGDLDLHVEKGRVAAAIARWCEDRSESVRELEGCPFGSRACAERLEHRLPAWAAAMRRAAF